MPIVNFTEYMTLGSYFNGNFHQESQSMLLVKSQVLQKHSNPNILQYFKLVSCFQYSHLIQLVVILAERSIESGADCLMQVGSCIHRQVQLFQNKKE